MQCWACGTVLQDRLVKKISFREVCEVCAVDLHSCSGCKFFQLGLSNNCKVPGTEKIVDREKNNFCDDFSFSDSKPLKPNGKIKRFEDLFK